VKNLEKGIAYYEKVRYYLHIVKKCSNLNQRGGLIMTNYQQALAKYYQHNKIVMPDLNKFKGE